jgi:hypothetical protein
MLPNGTRGAGRGTRRRARIIPLTIFAIALAAGAFAGLRASGRKPAEVQAVEQRLEVAELERQAVAARAEAVGARAAAARAATKPAVARAESLRAKVRVLASGQLHVESSLPNEPAAIAVPPLVTDRLQADSAAISALSVALTWDAKAAVAQEDRFVAEKKARDAASLTIAQLERERRPRCGRRCGFVLGAASVVALGIAADQTRRLLRP